MPFHRSRYPADWPAVSRAFRERNGGQCECEGGRGLHTTYALIESFTATICDIWSFSPVSTQVFIARVAPSFSERFARLSTYDARLWLLWATKRRAGSNESVQPAIFRHVASTTQNGDVVRFVVASIPVHVMAVYTRQTTPLARAKSVKPAGTISLGVGPCGVTLPCAPRGAANNWFLWPSEIPSSSAHWSIVPQRCHLRYDVKLHVKHAAERRRRKRLARAPELPGLGEPT